MELFLYLFAGLIAIGFLFVLIEYPYYLISIFVFLSLYIFNIPTPLPLDARGILLILLFIRLYIFDKENMQLVHKYLFSNKYFWLIVLFLTFDILVPFFTTGRIFGFLKEILLSIVVLILGFISLSKSDGRKSFLLGVILSGLISSIDIFFTFIQFGNLNIIRPLDLLIGKTVFLNHNYPGLLAGISVILLYLVWARNLFNRFTIVIISIFTAGGAILSTSRSTILALGIVFIIMNFKEKDLRENLRKVMTFGIVGFFSLITIFFIYDISGLSKQDKSYFNKLYYRLYEEPMQIFGAGGARFDKYSGKKIGGSMKFRENKWKEEINKFYDLALINKLVGLGPDGYLKIAKKEWGMWDNFKGQLAPHNGYLIILIERGIFGLLIFLFLIFGLIINYFKIKDTTNIYFPIVYALLMIVIYSFGQNAELTSRYTYLILGGVIANNYLKDNDGAIESTV